MLSLTNSTACFIYLLYFKMQNQVHKTSHFRVIWLHRQTLVLSLVGKLPNLDVLTYKIDVIPNSSSQWDFAKFFLNKMTKIKHPSDLIEYLQFFPPQMLYVDRN